MAPTKTLGALLALLVVATGAAAAMPGNAPVDAPDRADNQTTDAEAEAAQTETNETADDESGEADEERQTGGPPEEMAGERGPPEEMAGERGPPTEMAGERGPPEELPGAAPDFVSEIHATIQDHLSGAVEDLGSAISGITPGGEAGGEVDEGIDQADQGATETPDDAEETDQPAGMPA